MGLDVEMDVATASCAGRQLYVGENIALFDPLPLEDEDKPPVVVRSRLGIHRLDPVAERIDHAPVLGKSDRDPVSVVGSHFEGVINTIDVTIGYGVDRWVVADSAPTLRPSVRGITT